MVFLCSLTFNSCFCTLRRIIRKICIKEKLKFSFSSQKPDIVEVDTITNNGAMARQKKFSRGKFRSLKVQEAEGFLGRYRGGSREG